ncbi:hypothetical protein [Pseudomonas sp. CCOS 191]|uniref:hypothetical protein n=1 Tax=Pseudomonas sp. CCOS 191 TaxID=1649877 RepID=UPI00062460DC|nr:hypothetical protein [Pseudomonas sp. CCOS 191]CRI57136.1 hypothetical protein CCOS191_2600 [Pseudomonas sp. CCOS 191]
MLKIVPDPPLHDKYTTHTLEDLLVQISEYLVCALTVLLHAKPPGQVLTLAAMHEIDSARTLVEVALSRVQSRH